MSSLSTIAKGKGPLPSSKIKQLQEWIDDDWEAADINRDAVQIIKRLLLTIEEDRKWQPGAGTGLFEFCPQLAKIK
jgi:hypothetical protein